MIQTDLYSFSYKKKVHFCHRAKNATTRISTEMAKTKEAFKGTNAEIVFFVLCGQATCREEELLAIL